MVEKNEKGITLIALVITIIVLLILAGVAIATLTGENGVLTKANNAKTENDKAGAKEKVQIAVMGSYGADGKIDISELKENLKQTEGATGVDSITKLPATVKVDGYDVTIDEKGNVKLGSIKEQVDPIYARLYKKNDTQEQVLILASNESVFANYSGELTLFEDLENIYEERKKYETKEDLYEIPRYREIFESEEWKQFEAENPEEAVAYIEELLSYLNNFESSVKWMVDKGSSRVGADFVEAWILDEICPDTTEGWFEGCNELTKIIGIENLNTSKATSMRNMFNMGRNTENKLMELDVSGFDTSNVTDMSEMFCGCSHLTELDVHNFDTSNVTNMGSMFEDCTNLTQLDLSNFDTSKVTNMSSMFEDCTNLTQLDLSNFDTSNVTNMSEMFNMDNINDIQSALTQLDLSSFDTSNVTNMYKMFWDCSNLTKLDLSNFNTSNVTNMAWLFYGCSGLNQILVGPDWKEPEDSEGRRGMFSLCGVSKVTLVTP